MTCADRNESLLLLAHDALPWGQRWQTQWHMRRCTQCRARLAEYETVSRVMALTIGTQLPRGGFSQIPIVHGPRPGTSALAVSALVLVIATGLLAVFAEVVGTINPYSPLSGITQVPAHSSCAAQPIVPRQCPRLQWQTQPRSSK